jgi:hypothetical protein
VSAVSRIPLDSGPSDDLGIFDNRYRTTSPERGIVAVGLIEELDRDARWYLCDERTVRWGQDAHTK